MATPQVISLEFLLWSQLLVVWSAAAYGITADPLKGGDNTLPMDLLDASAGLTGDFGGGVRVRTASLGKFVGFNACTHSVATASPLSSTHAMASGVRRLLDISVHDVQPGNDSHLPSLDPMGLGVN